MKFTLAINLERSSPAEDMNRTVQHTLEMVQMAEAGGFEIVWVGEHHGIETNIGPAPFQLLAHFAAHTSTVRLGTACIVAPYWHPLKLAGEAALFDLLSGGRLELGIGRGAYQREFDIMAGGIDQKLGGAYMQEMLPALKALWQGDYAHAGHHWSFPTATSAPKPLQSPHPRIWVAARDPDTYEWALRNGCSIQSWAMTRPFSEVETYKQRFDSALSKYPQPVRPSFMTMRQTAVYAKEEDSRLPVEAVVRRSSQFENLFKAVGAVAEGFPEEVDLKQVSNRAEYDPRNLCDNLVFGQPDVVVRKLKQYESIGVDYFCFHTSYGLPQDFQKLSLKLFISQVMPAFS